ncbi:MAG: pyridoxal-phosphate dependent enzyme [Gemmatimonadota bacterium]
MLPLDPVPLEEIEAARRRIAGSAVRTPLVRLDVDGPAEVWLKLENLQPIGSFKLRGASNALAQADPSRLGRGVYTASAGNMAQGVAWNARRLGVPCSVVVPEGAPRTKLDAIARLGARSVPKPFAEWWNVLVEHGHPEMEGFFVHPVSDPAVLAGNATIGLEIVEDLPDVDAVVVAYGGGALSCGIACAVEALKPGTPVYAAEVDTAAPFAASLEAGSPQSIEWVRSFVDGIGSRGVLPEMWPLANKVLAGSIVSSLADVARAVRLLVERSRVVAEGAGAAAVAGALSGRAGTGKVVAVVSGGNIDLSTLARILAGADS